MPSTGSRDVIVVGAGIIGATITKHLRARGLQVLLLDDGRPKGGTAPSGGHLKPSWMGGMKSAQYEPAMALLNEVWGLREEKFIVRPSNIGTTVWRVDTDQVVAYPKTKATVLEVICGSKPGVRYSVGLQPVIVQAKLVIVAAGVWCSDLLEGVSIQAKQGVSFRVPGRLKLPFIKPWAPYKQVVAHQQGDNEIWVGDGTAILEKNWKDTQTETCLQRCQAAVNIHKPSLSITGLRPYCDTQGDPCLFQLMGPGVYVATGAGKMGTIAAGWVTGKVFELCQ